MIDLSLDYSLPDGRVLYSKLQVQIDFGEWLLIRGPNGSGKTTLLKQLIHLLEEKYRISYLPQHNTLDLPFPLSLHELISFECPNVSDQEIIDIGLLSHESLKYKWSDASGGERKKALLTRVLLTRPEYLLLDEPFNHLDKVTRVEILRILSDHMLRGDIKSIIMVSHNFENTSIPSDIRIREVSLDS